MTPLRWLKQSLRNLEAIHAYYVSEGVPSEAHKILSTIRKSAMQLEQFPALGRPGRVADTRELVVARTPYIIVYRARASMLQVLRVLHSSQKWPRSDEE
jgi:toxin ParE1/3/4